MKTVKRVIALLLVLVMTAGLVACGGGMEKPKEAGDRTVVYYAASYVTAQVQPAYKEMVEAYNNGQGVIDNVYVQMRENSGAISGLDSALRGNYQYDVLELHDDEYKTLAMQGNNFFVDLDKYLTDDAKTAMQWDQIPTALVNRFRMNTKPSEGGKFLAGEGATLLALPNGSDPQVLFYNKSILTDCGINVISVPEEYIFRIIKEKGKYYHQRFGINGNDWKKTELDTAAIEALCGDGVNFKLERTSTSTLTLSVNGVVYDNYIMAGVTVDTKVTTAIIGHYGNKGEKIALPLSWFITTATRVKTSRFPSLCSK